MWFISPWNNAGALQSLITHPTEPLSSVSALLTTDAGFASSHRLGYAAHLVSGPARCPSSWGAPVFPLEVLEDWHFELGFLAATVPHLCAMLLAPEGDPDALDIPIPRNHTEAVSGPSALYWIAAGGAAVGGTAVGGAGAGGTRVGGAGGPGAGDASAGGTGARRPGGGASRARAEGAGATGVGGAGAGGVKI
ncbi:unnamed protein product [Closterium sp. NIES-54]